MGDDKVNPFYWDTV